MTDSDRLLEVHLTRIGRAARDINTYEFVRSDGGLLPAAEPGAHIDLHLGNGMVRQYSLTVPAPAPASYVIAVKRDPASRGGSQYIFENLSVGDALTISSPRNLFPLNPDARHSVLIAGGIGITPIWSMVTQLRKLGRSFELYYSSRSETDMAFVEQLKAMAGVMLHFDDRSGGRFLDLSAIIGAAPSDAHLYCCGPMPMLRAFEDATSNWDAEQIHVEYFTPKETPSLKGGFTVELARTGRELVIPPGKSILEVLHDEGLYVPFACGEGICGTCETRVLSGVPDHHDSVLNEAERAANNRMMICCSGCKGNKLVLDI